MIAFLLLACIASGAIVGAAAMLYFIYRTLINHL